MKTLLRSSLVPLLFLLMAGASLPAKEDSLVIAVHSKASGSYQRRRLPDGNIKPQTYVVGNGGMMGQPRSPGEIDGVAFPTVVQLLATKLVRQSYYPSRNAMAADLLLVVSWGETTPFSDSQLKNAYANFGSALNASRLAESAVQESARQGERQFSLDGIQSPTRSVRDAAQGDAESQLFQSQLFEHFRSQSDEASARLLGYVEEINRRNNPSRFAGTGDYFNELVNDLETERYFVIVQAYDFQVAVKEHRRQLLWTTRISIPASGSVFSKCLPAMLADASEYFGRNSDGLVRRYRTGVVKMGEMNVLGVEPMGTPAASSNEENN